MIRPHLLLSAVVLASASVLAQAPESAPRSMLHPIDSPVRDAGVYHLGLGTWTRRIDTANGITHDIIYSNTCPVGYYAGLLTNEYIADEGRVPGPMGPRLCDTGLLSTNAGCHCSYNVCGFQIAYCSGINGPGQGGGPGPVKVNIGFQGAYVACAAPSVLPGSPGTFTLNGLPGAGLAPAVKGCWLVTIDLDAAGQSFTLPADGASCTWLPNGDLATHHLFGWTFQNLTTVTGVGHSFVGPFIAGNGGPHAPIPACSMVDNTRWDTLSCTGQGGGPNKWPNNLTEDGFGMDTQDRFRDDTTNITGGPTSPPYVGCYFFGGGPFCSFHLKLFADTGCPVSQPGQDFCFPAQSGTIACPCSNPGLPGHGCENSSSTGGALLTSAGNASLAAPLATSVVFTATGEKPNATSILLQGRAPAFQQGIPFGMGVRCAVLVLKRLFSHTASSGIVTAPTASDNTTIPARSAVLGDVIQSGETRLYLFYYRDPILLGGCTLPSTFNCTQGQSVVWGP